MNPAPSSPAIAVHDHGGDGPPLLLLHGAGRTRADWDPLVPALTARHRVLAMDLRGHGESEAGPWTVPAVLGDIERALDRFGAPEALPVGHSLGGMFAALHARANPGTTPGAVNLDGHGYGRIDQYVGIDPAYAVKKRVEMDRMIRSFWKQEDLADLLDSLDLDAVYREVAAHRPLLVVLSQRLLPPDAGMEWFGELMAAYFKGLERDLGALDTELPLFTLSRIDASHDLLREAPDDTVRIILDFAARLTVRL